MLRSHALQSICTVLLIVRAVSTLEDTADVRLALETLSTLPVRFEITGTTGLDWLFALLTVRRTDAVKSMSAMVRGLGTFTTLFDLAFIVLSTDKSMIAHPPWFDPTGTADFDWLLATLVMFRPDTFQPLCTIVGVISTFLTLCETALLMLAGKTFAANPERINQTGATDLDRLLAALVVLRADAVQAAGTPFRIVLALAVKADTATPLASESLRTHPVRILSAAGTDWLQQLAATLVRGANAMQTLVALARTGGTVAAGGDGLVSSDGSGGDQRQQQNNSSMEVHGEVNCWYQ